MSSIKIEASHPDTGKMTSILLAAQMSSCRGVVMVTCSFLYAEIL
ncbi:hypothetical protein [Marinomonas mediterranea]|jgi:hypothetical protein|uniref:Uncharacterized protein n=1 Tax=Marinomonas mediterranea (strain ATCC 700492 / JCM 21426 / NBRC 103028 / MMB-1) TaxID=717774 RepID=F2JYC9_MARM1|nr:hypothetical protein [Marinomonas mediterranea]ADZ91960.1 hypothetical protein Marme_2731 [Marinomonas mediterranea MMB-1]